MRRGLIAALALIVSVWVTPAAFAVFHPGDIIVGDRDGVILKHAAVGFDRNDPGSLDYEIGGKSGFRILHGDLKKKPRIRRASMNV